MIVRYLRLNKISTTKLAATLVDGTRCSDNPKFFSKGVLASQQTTRAFHQVTLKYSTHSTLKMRKRSSLELAKPNAANLKAASARLNLKTATRLREITRYSKPTTPVMQSFTPALTLSSTFTNLNLLGSSRESRLSLAAPSLTLSNQKLMLC